MKLLLECTSEQERLQCFQYHTYKSLQDVWEKCKIRFKKVLTKKSLEKRREVSIIPHESFIYNANDYFPTCPDYSFWRESMSDWDEPLVLDLSHYTHLRERERDRTIQSIKIVLSHLTHCPHPAKLYFTGNQSNVF